MWQPSAPIQSLHKRAALLTKIREFFNQRGYLEVETPIMGRFGTTDVYLSNLNTQFRNVSYALQTSPEYHMKRLLAAGSGPIFQVARVFRDDELGRWHNPEFTLLEWYQLNVDHHDLMIEIDQLLQLILESKPLIKKNYQHVFLEACSIDPFNTSVAQLKRVLKEYDLDNVLEVDEEDLDQYFFLLMSHVVEPFLSQLNAPVAVYNFPESQASLAQVKNGIAERFEVYYQGIELANGFHELCDATIQAKRFTEDQRIRARKGLVSVAGDTHLLDALKHGLPACSGVALGIDRLLALAFNYNEISKVISFDIIRA